MLQLLLAALLVLAPVVGARPIPIPVQGLGVKTLCAGSSAHALWLRLPHAVLVEA
jgi:hypothetical protein